MNMKRNRKSDKEKEIIRIKGEINKNWQDQRNQAWIELDKPIRNGWDGEWVLREDISRSPESVVLNYIIDTWGRTCWSRRKDFTIKERFSKKWVDIKPHFISIDEDTYHDLHDKVQKYFREDTSERNWWRKRYVVSIDYWKLELKKSRSYITHYKEHDEILKQEEAELEAELYRLTPKPWGNYATPRWWRRCERRKAKTKHKSDDKELINAYNSGGFEDDYYTSYKTISMFWWG